MNADDAIMSGLNPEQQQAVTTTEGPLLVLAGAGTGKTRVLTSRIAHILHRGLAFPSQILAVTFTNKAAREMKERVERAMGAEVQGLWLGTFHAIGTKILRRHAEVMGLRQDFTIIDTDDQLRVLKQLMAELSIDEKRWPVRVVSGEIQRYKDRGLMPGSVPASMVSEVAGGRMLEVYAAYQARLKSLSAVDFGDLLLYPLHLLSTDADILAQYQRRFKYVLVDEYQDTNVAQYLWLRLLAQGHHNLCCVGDDDQSIYGWRGAEVGNILKFEKDFPGATVIRLERNYRSTKDILATASHLIGFNQGRLGKTLWTENPDTQKVKVVSLWDEKHEAQYVGEEIENLQRAQKLPLSDAAILVRAGFQTRAFEEAFVSMGIPYKVVGGLRFYERMEIRDAIAYLRLTMQPLDDLAFERIINVPKRGLGESTLAEIRSFAGGRQLSLLQAVQQMLKEGLLKARVRGTLETFCNQLTLWQQAALNAKPHELMKKVLEESNYLTMWRNEKTPEAEGRIENIKELFTALEEFESTVEFLEHVSLVTDADKVDESEMVNIMTLHAAKGLEFSSVFLTGWEEGLFPHQRSMDEKGKEGLEEERRLAYVGITRARAWLTITFAGNRRIYNQWQSSIPSRFIDELPPEHTEIVRTGTGYRAPAAGGQRQVFNSGKMYGANKAVGTPAAPVVTPSAFASGTRVFHQKFGYGIIRKASGEHLTIAFDKAGIKTVMQGYVEKV